MSASTTAEPDAGAILFKESLEMRLQTRTGGRLRFLAIELVGSRVRINAAAPSYHVRQLAEQAALRILPAARLELSIEVSPPAAAHEDLMKFARSEEHTSELQSHLNIVC